MLDRLGGCVAAVAIGVLALPGAAGAQTFGPGVEQTYVVPPGVTEVNINAVGAPGGGGCQILLGGRGAQISADFPVTPGENLYVEVGGPGGLGMGICMYGAVTPGGNGGGTGGELDGGGGGGASDVRTVPLAGAGTLGSRMIVAGGGGGGGTPAPGGDAGSQGADGTGGLGGGPGTASGPGAAGTTIGSGCGTGNSSTAGGLGMGGNGGGSTTNPHGGGGGGGGYYGGGGGGACIGQTTTGGGGGGGSSYVAPEGLNATTAAPTSLAPEITITPVTALAVSPAAGLVFPGTQAEETVSAPQTLTVQNTGGGTIHVSGVTLTGTDPQDFSVSSNTCPGSLASGATCTVGVIFGPQGQGARDATLTLASDDVTSPASVPVMGTGGPPLAQPAGPPPAQPAGGPGTSRVKSKVDLVTCSTVTKRLKRTVRQKTRRVKVTKHVCRAKVVSGTVGPTSAGERASISRGHLVYASGTGVSTGAGRWKLTLAGSRSLRPGRYTLTLVRRRGRRTITTRLRVTIT